MKCFLSAVGAVALALNAQAGTVSFIETPIVVRVITGDSEPTFYAGETVLNQQQLNDWLKQTAKKFGNQDMVYFLCDDRASVESLKVVDAFAKSIYPNRFFLLTSVSSQPQSVIPVTEASEAEMAVALEVAKRNFAAEPFKPNIDPKRVNATGNWDRPIRHFRSPTIIINREATK